MVALERKAGAGRPEATSHAAIEQAAFRLFAERGFDQTTLDAIAREVGVSRRTLFRYYRSKNDIPWGQFDKTLDGLRELLAASPDDLSLFQAIGRAIVRFNEFPQDASPLHADRMRLILETPALQAHSVLRYAQWRGVISGYAARRLGMSELDVLPQVIGQVSLALALTSYGAWLLSPQTPVTDYLAEAMRGLVRYVADVPAVSASMPDRTDQVVRGGELGGGHRDGERGRLAQRGRMVDPLI